MHQGGVSLPSIKQYELRAIYAVNKSSRCWVDVFSATHQPFARKSCGVRNRPFFVTHGDKALRLLFIPCTCHLPLSVGVFYFRGESGWRQHRAAPPAPEKRSHKRVFLNTTKKRKNNEGTCQRGLTQIGHAQNATPGVVWLAPRGD